MNHMARFMVCNVWLVCVGIRDCSEEGRDSEWKYLHTFLGS